MHTINFALKRAHLSTNNFGRKMLESNVRGMTPARFDILCYLRQAGIRKRAPKVAFATQQRIIEVLGLHASTISKMLARLEEMGWITRQRHSNNHRIKVVSLTKVGLSKIWKAMRIVFRMRIWAKHYEYVVRLIRPDLDVLRALDFVVGTIEVIAGLIGDESTFQYDHGSPRRPAFWMYKPPPEPERWRHDYYPKVEPYERHVESPVSEEDARLDECVERFLRARGPHGPA